MIKFKYIKYYFFVLIVGLQLLNQSCDRPVINKGIEKTARELKAESFPEPKNYNDQSTLERILWNDPLRPVKGRKHYEVLPATIKIPEGMLFIPGKSQINQELLIGFFADSNAVSFADFKAFVEATNYRTTAEINGYSFIKKNKRTDANWIFPEGPFGEKTKHSAPVVHLSLEDGKAYCQWKNKRIPTEKEWSYILNSKDVPMKNKMGYTWTNSWVYPKNTHPWLFVPEADSKKIVLGFIPKITSENEISEPEILQFNYPKDYSSSEICLRCVMDIETAPKTKLKSVNTNP